MRMRAWPFGAGLALVAAGCSQGIDPPELPAAIRIEGGTFTMGAAGVTAPGGAIVADFDPCDDGVVTTGGKKSLACGAELMSEVIRHPRTVATFCIDQTEVTVDQYRHCVARDACDKPKSTNAGNRGDGFIEKYYDQDEGTSYGNHPVLGVTHAQARAYCAFRGGRLPTEAEWEFVATSRGARSSILADGSLVATLPNGCDASEGSRNAVAYGSCTGNSLLAVREASADVTAQAVHDMAGNAQEWVLDEFDHLAYCDPDQPSGALTTLYRMDEASRRPLAEAQANLPNALLSDDSGACLDTPESGISCGSSDDCPGDEVCRSGKCATPHRNKYTGGCNDQHERCLGVCTEAWRGESIAESVRRENWQVFHCEAIGGDAARNNGGSVGSCDPQTHCEVRDQSKPDACVEFCGCLNADPTPPEGDAACLERCVEAYAECAADCSQPGVVTACTKPDITNDPDTNRPRPWCVPLADGTAAAHQRPEKFDADFLRDTFVVRGGHFQESASCGVRPARRSFKSGSSPRIGFRCAYDTGSERCN